MARLVEFEMDDGSTVLVEVNDPIGSTPRRGVPGQIVERADQSFESALDKVKPAASVVISKLRNLTETPDEIAVQFGLKLSGHFGAIVASSTAEANFSVTLTWTGDQR